MSVLHEMLEIGRRRRRGGVRRGPVAQFDVGGRKVSIREMARECGISETTMRYHMTKKHCTLAEAAEYYRAKQRDREYRREEAARRERAAEEILGIIMEG